MNETLNFTFDIKTANLILQALSNMSYAQVVDVIADMQKQAANQPKQSDATDV